MLMTEYDYEADIRVKQEEAEQIGWTKGRNEGRNEGISIGENRLTMLIGILAKAGRMNDIIRISEDKDYCNQLLNEFVTYNA